MFTFRTQSVHTDMGPSDRHLWGRRAGTTPEAGGGTEQGMTRARRGISGVVFTVVLASASLPFVSAHGAAGPPPQPPGQTKQSSPAPQPPGQPHPPGQPFGPGTGKKGG